ncbi:MAG: glycoside hydrolase family 25 protein [Flammeovirgaceae bacterium]
MKLLRVLFFLVSVVILMGVCPPETPLERISEEEKRIEKIVKIFKGKTYGIDVSEYQHVIAWNNLGWIRRGAGISFALIRATVGEDRPDNYFTYNWRESRKNGFIRGAYHYYRPNENSMKQANNFIAKVELSKGDLPPVLDIEALPDTTVQTVERLRLGLKRWLKAVEDHYGVKPIIYTYENFFKWHLQGHGFEKYPLWVANYNPVWGPDIKGWKMWQFSRKGKIRGVKGNVDLNVFRGDLKKLRALTLKK